MTSVPDGPKRLPNWTESCIRQTSAPTSIRCFCDVEGCKSSFCRPSDLVRHKVSSIHGPKQRCHYFPCGYATGRVEKINERIWKMHKSLRAEPRNIPGHSNTSSLHTSSHNFDNGTNIEYFSPLEVTLNFKRPATFETHSSIGTYSSFIGDTCFDSSPDDNTTSSFNTDTSVYVPFTHSSSKSHLNLPPSPDVVNADIPIDLYGIGQWVDENAFHSNPSCSWQAHLAATNVSISDLDLEISDGHGSRPAA